MTTASSPAIERLRSAPKVEMDKPTVAQLRGIVDGLALVQPLSDIAAQTGLEESRVLDLVAKLGTWLTHVNGGSGAVPVSRADESQQILFQVAASARPRPGGDERQSGRKQHPSLASRSRRESEPPKVYVPLGFERRGPHKRDVSRALAAVVVADPDDATLTRFIEREYPTRSRVLTFTVLSSVWWHAANGYLDNIDTLNPDNPVLGELLVEAYDLLAASISQAQEGIKALYDGDVSDLDRLAHACTKARWLAEAEIARLERGVNAARHDPKATPVLRRELAFFHQRVVANWRSYDIGVGELNAGQVRRIAEAAGIRVETTSRAEETEIRNRLKEMNFTSDLDRLVPAGLRAAEAGAIDTFWEAMEERRAGRVDWQERLAEAISAS